MIGSLRLTLGLVVSLTATGGLAQGESKQAVESADGTGSRLNGSLAAAKAIPYENSANHDADRESAARAIATAHGMADCVVASHSEDVNRFLKTPADSADQQMAFRRLSSPVSRCLGSQTYNLDYSMLQLSRPMIRGLLAESYVRRFAARGFRLSQVDPISYSEPWMSSASQVHTTQTMALCLVVEQPQQVYALIMTKPSSTAEKTELVELGSMAQSCLTRGTTLKASPANMRASLAEAFYHHEFGGPVAATSARKN